MIDILKQLGFDTAPTINEFIDKCDSLEEIRAYNEFLKGEPQRKDFLDFDNEGFALNDNEPMFKNWFVCEETSIENTQVARIDNNRVYFNTDNGVFLMNDKHLSDNLTYNELFIFFEGNLELN